MDDAESPSSAFDPSRPHVARVYDYLLGGKDNFAAGRSLGDQIIASLPTAQVGVRAQLHHLLDSGDPAVAGVQAAFQKGMGRGQFRTLPQIQSLFSGLELVEPGLVLVSEWRPDAGTPSAGDLPVLRLACAGGARKP